MNQPSEKFVHLHVHSEYSLADGIVRIDELVKRAAEYAQPAVALTDLGNLHGMVKFYRACMRHGVKPIIGCDVWLQTPFDRAPQRLKLLCQNNAGYAHLSQLLSAAHLRERRDDKAVIAWDELAARAEGLLAIIDDAEGALAAAFNSGRGDADANARTALKTYQDIFPARLYLEVSRIQRAGESTYIQRAGALAAAEGVPLVATNRAVFLRADDFDAHEIRVCINERRVLGDSRRPRRFTAQQYLRDTREMRELFADLPQAIDNGVEIAKRCNLFLDFNRNHLPDYPGADAQNADALLREQSERGLCERLGVAHGEAPPLYRERLEMELGVIASMQFSAYFLIVADFIRWSRDNDIPVGPGRGSGAGSLVAWVGGITELDPIAHDLLFERFLNPERMSLPDLDIDFCVDGRDRVIEYVAKKYGRERVAQIVTFGTMAAKAAVRDVGRVMEMSYGFVDEIANLIPVRVGVTLREALKEEQTLRERRENESEVRDLIDNAMQLEGIVRNVSTHAGGVVIAPSELIEYTPLNFDAQSRQAITQLDKDDLEAIGLIKFDFLGLRTLTILDMTMKMVNRAREAQNQAPLNLDELPLDDAATYQLIQSGKTTAVFQLESTGMKELIGRLHPDTFADLVALVALYRPGPLQSGMVDEYIERKHKRKPVDYIHPDLRTVLEPTHGVIVYQEQVMKIAQVLAGYSLGDADFLRKAMGKKQPEEMAKQREVFLKGANKLEVEGRTAAMVFDSMEKFAEYGFNKSHSVAYALVAYQTAWLKAHYPAEFMASTLSSDMSKTDEKVAVFLEDCKEIGLEILPPNINACEYQFKPLDDKRILYGLGAVKGIGKGAVEQIVAERKRGEKFSDLFEFCARVSSGRSNKRIFEALIKSGAMDELGGHRAALMHELPHAMQAAEQQQQNQLTGQGDMFGVAAAPPAPQSAAATVAEWDEDSRLAAEKESLGLYLSGHPYKKFRRELSGVADATISEEDLEARKNGVFAGLIVRMRTTRSRQGKIAFVTLDNADMRIDVTVYTDKFRRDSGLLQEGKLLIAQGELSRDDYTNGVRMQARSLYDLDLLRASFLRAIQVRLHESEITRDLLRELQNALSPHRGGRIALSAAYRRADGGAGRLIFGENWRMKPAPALLPTLQTLLGEENIICRYDAAAIRNGGAQHEARG